MVVRLSPMMRLAVVINKARPRPDRVSLTHIEPPIAATTVAPPLSAPGAAPSQPELHQPTPEEVVRQALGPILACAHPDEFHLTSAERDRCLRQAREQVAGGRAFPVLPLNAELRQGLERGARNNAAGRSYRNSTRMDDYPGLGAALGLTDPCPAAQTCWHHLP